MDRCTAFIDHHLLAAGSPIAVAQAMKHAQAQDDRRTLLAFDDATGRVVEFDLRGSDADVAARLDPAPPVIEPTAAPRAVGRPKLGVTGREVTLLPRHWDWLASQRGGASVTLRKLVDTARAANRGRDLVAQAQAACDRFMLTMLGNQAGYEEAARALYKSDAVAFQALSEPWPVDLRDYARRLAAAAFVSEPTEDAAEESSAEVAPST